MTIKNKIRPVVLVILDGWGLSDKPENNAIFAADTPVWDKLWAERPHCEIQTSGAAVGLPGGQMGNSEVGHLNLGAGRVVYQEFTRVSRSIRTGSFFTNRTLTDAVDLARDNDKTLHILGLLSPGGVHSHECHIHAMARLAVERGLSKVVVHAFLDGRDMPPKSAEKSLQDMEDIYAEIGAGRTASIIGRYFAMDRDHRWERIQQSYDLITQGEAEYEAETAVMGLEMAYARGETDEFVAATRIVPPGGTPAFIEDGDVVINMNYRSDRARQITRPFIEADFDGFERDKVRQLGGFASLTEYNSEFDNPVAFPPERLNNVFGQYISALGLRQLRIAETEKYAHVTFFFNGGREQPFDGEDRILIPSPKVATYDLQPEMSAAELTDQLVNAIAGDAYDVIIVNYANGDMVGHTGKLDAAVEAIEVLDKCIDRVVTAVENAGGALLITADHGNAEQMMDQGTGQAHTAHTCNPVPLVFISNIAAGFPPTGALCDIAPTMLQLMGLEPPAEMTGKALLEIA